MLYVLQIAQMELTDLRLAVLIDADNVSHTYVKEMLQEIARYGTPTIKRIYGDWTQPNLSGWKKILLENAVTPVQQYAYTQGKNSTDSAMIIDAMDILYTGKADGFCIVSSDCDFTRLATRLREAGVKVIGMGEKKTPQPFIASCDKFIYLEILMPQKTKKALPKKEKNTHSGPEEHETVKQEKKLPEDIVELIESSVEDLADDAGWAYLGDIGNLLLKKCPSFDSRNYGYRKLTQLMAAVGTLEIDQRDTGNKTVKHIYIRLKSVG